MAFRPGTVPYGSGSNVLARGPTQINKAKALACPCTGSFKPPAKASNQLASQRRLAGRGQDSTGQDRTGTDRRTGKVGKTFTADKHTDPTRGQGRLRAEADRKILLGRLAGSRKGNSQISHYYYCTYSGRAEICACTSVPLSFPPSFLPSTHSFSPLTHAPFLARTEVAGLSSCELDLFCFSSLLSHGRSTTGPNPFALEPNQTNPTQIQHTNLQGKTRPPEDSVPRSRSSALHHHISICVVAEA